MNRQKNFLKIFCFLVFLSFLYNSVGQERYVLKENDIPGYGIYSIKKYENLYTQYWGSVDSINSITIKYFEYKTEEEALDLLPYSVGYFTIPFVYGSPFGSILWNRSWTSLDGQSIYFQKWNIVIHVTSFPEKEHEVLDMVIKKLEQNVNDSIPDLFYIKDLELNETQIPKEDYVQLTKSAFDTLESNGYSEVEINDTKWMLGSDSLVMGLRHQWSKETSFFSIDISKYSNPEDAVSAAINMDSLTWSPHCFLNDDESVKNAIDKSLSQYIETKRFISVTGSNNYYAFHFYYYEQDSIDPDFFYRILKTFMPIGTGNTIVKSTNIRLFPNPAKDVIIIDNNTIENTVSFYKIFNLHGQLLLSGKLNLYNSNTLNVSRLKPGVYIMKLKNSHIQLNKKFIIQ